MKYCFLIILLLNSYVWASDQPLVVLPKNSGVTLLKQSDSIFHFNGIFELKGLLVARWGKNLSSDAHDAKKLYLQFLPEQDELIKLPYVNDSYNQDNKMISLNYNTKDALRNEKIVRQFFSRIPASFWQRKEEILELPVMLKFDKYKMEISCDYRYYYAELISIIKIEQLSNVISMAFGCDDNYIFSDQYSINSANRYANFRIGPNTQAQIIQTLPNGIVVKKLNTQGNWLKVKITSEHPLKNQEGYIHKSQLILGN